MGILDSINDGLAGVLGQWNGYSTAIVTVIVMLVSVRIAYPREADTHPMLLAWQATPSPVRHEHQSAVYRSHAAPHGMPLLSGLNVRDPETPKWALGREGDLRDVWRKAAVGGENGAKGRILTVLGSQNVIEHKIEDLTRQINLIGQHIAEQGGIRVAVYLPNSIELLVTLFACSFYPNLTTVLIPFDVSNDELLSMLRRSAVDTVVTAPGAFPFDTLVKAYPALRQLIWVVDEGSKHLDWNEVPEGTGGSVNVATWSDIINDAPVSAGAELPPLEPGNAPNDVVTFSQTKSGQLEEMVRFSQGNIVAGIASQLTALPKNHRIGPADLFLPVDSLINIYTLTLTLAALYSNSSVALNSVSGKSADFVLATQGVAPTVVVASPDTLRKTHEESKGKLTSALGKLSHTLATRTLSLEGSFAPTNLLSAFSAASRPPIGTTPGKLRLLFVGQQAGADQPQLSSQVLSDLRIFTGARVVYALTAAKVAGAVSQTGFFDYRISADGTGHFGAPVTSVEVYLKDSGAHRTTDDSVAGEVCLSIRFTEKMAIANTFRSASRTWFVGCRRRN